ncbi:hypothetical protein Strvi_9382 (plasmid) [Streptomyces violaceusniger Tu 4113]|uniref:Uncharacterized protein n=2 Tax=Streptomyces violaceusniger TaxID=68280 RepID=G2PGS8_STRV4|nr:hypothetical protein Strvi_9382 [Streptomyces violaceusniger Tu 4113]
MCLAEDTGTLGHVETILILVCGRAPECSLAGLNHVCIDLIRKHSTPTTARNDTPYSPVSPCSQGLLTWRHLWLTSALGKQTDTQTGMMSIMHATPTNPLDVETFAEPAQQRRFAAAMHRIAADRPPGVPVRVYISAAPRTRNNPKWENWLAQITDELPDGVQILHYGSLFSEDRPYDWETVADDLDGLVVVGKQKRPGSRVNLLGPIARLELRSLVARKPALLYGHNLGLIPVIDCKSQVLAPEDAPRLKLIAPKRWRKDDSPTLHAALRALRPRSTDAGTDHDIDVPRHLIHPFAAPPR